MEDYKQSFYDLSSRLQEEICNQIAFKTPDCVGLRDTSNEDWTKIHVCCFADAYLRYALRTIAGAANGRNDCKLPLNKLDDLLKSRVEELDERVNQPKELRNLILGITKKILLDKASSGFQMHSSRKAYTLRQLDDYLLVEQS